MREILIIFQLILNPLNSKWGDILHDVRQLIMTTTDFFVLYERHSNIIGQCCVLSVEWRD